MAGTGRSDSREEGGGGVSGGSLGSDLPSLAIRRPLLVLVMNLLIALAGFAAIFGVEVRELPDVDRPVVSVRGDYPGASPETMDSEVTSIVEGAVARVNGVRAIRSSSEENNFRIHVEFSPGEDLDTAASDVREAVSRVADELPDAVERLTVVKADADAEPIVRLAAYSDMLSEEALTYIVENDIVPELISIDGVADVSLYGDRQRLLRVVLDPLRLTSFGLSVTDVAEVLDNAPFDVPAGSFRSEDQELIVRADASVVTAAQVEDLNIRDTVKIRDVAEVYFGPEDALSYVRLDGRHVVGMGIIRQASSNTVEISAGVRQAVEELNDRFEDVELAVTSDDAIFIRGSIREVLTTLLIAVVIVVGTIWLFIGSPRATLIPTIAIPIALIGTISAIWILGFSINLLTLLALVLATGMIVDDSIVVLENIQRRKGQGLASRAAAVLGTRQVFFAVVATTLTLISVFVPISFLPSTAGRLFREFGFVLAIAVGISSFVALSLVPALAARLPEVPVTQVKPLVAVGSWLARFYARSLDWALKAPLVVAALAVAFAGLALLIFQGLDEELLPPEDRGTIFIFATGPDGVGLPYSSRQADRIEAILEPYVESGEIQRVLSIVGRWDLNRVFVIAPLAPWEQRARSQQEIIDELRGPMAQIPGVRASVFSPNSLGLRGTSGGGGIEVALIGNDYQRLFEAAKAFARGIEDELPNLTEPDISYQPTQPQLSVTIDRRRAADLGLPLDDISATLRAMIDGDELVDLNVDGEAVPIQLEAAGGAIDDPSDLTNLYVRSESGALVPLSSVATLTEEGVAAELDRHRQRRAIEVEANMTSGYPLRDAVDDLQGLAQRTLPENIDMILLGEAETLQETSQQVAMTYAIALLVVFLVLTAQFESLTSAAVVLVTVPFGIAAAVLALFLTGTSINIYSQIGLVMLIGLMAKNGILVVEFADQLRDRGLTIRDAAATAATVRLRPIAMTLISTVLGGLPLILSDGPGAESRAAIGWVVFGGLGLAAVFTLYLAPVAYLGLARFAKPRAAEGARLERELRLAEEIPDIHDDRATKQAAE
jgi:hydrophobe/amphiphile efflux-1 (HAE1) family protein